MFVRFPKNNYLSKKNIMSEYCKIPNFKKYEIAKNGTVRNCTTKKEISVHYNTNGYKAVNIKCDDGKRKLISIHRLIAFTFIPNPHNKPQVNHIDGNKLNNSIENLEWTTLDENISHAIRTGLIKGRQYCTNSNALRQDIKKELEEIMLRRNVSKWLLKRIIFEDIR